MKTITILMNGQNAAMFTLRCSMTTAKVQAEMKMQSIANRFKVDLSAMSYSIR